MYRRPWRLQADNFTPPQRTPWGGRHILDNLKRAAQIEQTKRCYRVVGESWEVSVEPSYPSRVISEAGAPLLGELIAQRPKASLGDDIANEYGGLPLLLKLLDAAENLSVQVHPSDGYCGLTPEQSGKPEAWYVVRAAPGSGLYLGFVAGVTSADLREALGRGDDLRPMLNFVPVNAGDCFQIDAGTVHAVGAGVTLVEPQTVRPGKQGVTYRFWDWNRRYDKAGVLSAEGEPRDLHVEDSLAVVDLECSGPEAVERTRCRPTLVEQGESIEWHRLIDGQQFALDRIVGGGQVSVTLPAMTAGLVLRGDVQCLGQTGSLSVRQGEPFVLPAAVEVAECILNDAELILSWPKA